MRIELNCAKCGENKFDLRHTVPDETPVSCAACGHKMGTMAELKERVADEVLKRRSKAKGQRPF